MTGTPQPLSPDAEVTLLRVTQEALANVTRHASAGRVAVTLSYMDGEAALDVRDDGSGFTPDRRRLRSQRRARAAWHARAGRGPRGPAGRRDRPRPGHHHRGHGPGAVIRILLADDHPVVRDGRRGMLAGEADFEVVGEAASGVEAVRLTEREQPDVVLMDLQMPEMDGATATAEIAALERGSIALPRRSP